MLITIREESPNDVEAIRKVNQQAFGQVQESRLIDALRANKGFLLSLVATLNDRVIGHILYSPVYVSNNGDKIIGAGLGPMAVLPEYQHQGVGSKLVDIGNQMLQKSGFPFIVVLGHPEYYPRFGFRPASAYGLKCKWDVPDDVFMVLIMDQSKMETISGLVKYREEFTNIE